MLIYSSLPNRRGSRSKRGGGKDEPFLISVVPKSMVLKIFRPVTAIKRRTRKFLIKKQKNKKSGARE